MGLASFFHKRLNNEAVCPEEERKYDAHDDNTAIVTRNSTMAFDTSFHFAFRFILKHLWQVKSTF